MLQYVKQYIIENSILTLINICPDRVCGFKYA